MSTFTYGSFASQLSHFQCLYFSFLLLSFLTSLPHSWRPQHSPSVDAKNWVESSGDKTALSLGLEWRPGCCPFWPNLTLHACLVVSVVSDSLQPHSPPGSSVHGILWARILEWVGTSSSRGSSWPRDQTWVSCIGRCILYHWVTREIPWDCWVRSNRGQLEMELEGAGHVEESEVSGDGVSELPGPSSRGEAAGLPATVAGSSRLSGLQQTLERVGWGQTTRLPGFQGSLLFLNKLSLGS